MKFSFQIINLSRIAADFYVGKGVEFPRVFFCCELQTYIYKKDSVYDALNSFVRSLYYLNFKSVEDLFCEQ